MKKSRNENTLITPTSNRISAAGKTVIGEQVSIEGSIQGNEDLVIEGSVKGSIKLEKYHLTVGPKGKVEGEIEAGDLTISGQLVGNVRTLEKVEIAKNGQFNGEIKAKRIAIEDGAYLKAVIEIEQEPETQMASTRKVVDATASALEKEPVAPVSEAQKRK